MTLYNLIKPPGLRVEQSALALAVKKIVDTLAQNNLVHGDLRSNNLFVYVNSDGAALLTDGSVLAKAIDFDWSGESGKVTYPLLRNSELRWHAKVGDAIVVGHDEALVKDWWSTMFPGEVFPSTIA
ncbi:hypothetical protein FS842_006146 [Serendipita sp. 407]|nr:hypothetical protein FS842_006146 [Serendipita sp. 407]